MLQGVKEVKEVKELEERTSLLTSLLDPLSPMFIHGPGPWPAFAIHGVTVNVSAFESPPPGEGLRTVTWAEPETLRSLAGMKAFSLVRPR